MREFIKLACVQNVLYFLDGPVALLSLGMLAVSRELCRRKIKPLPKSHWLPVLGGVLGKMALMILAVIAIILLLCSDHVDYVWLA
jgi:hypothetical protein